MSALRCLFLIDTETWHARSMNPADPLPIGLFSICFRQILPFFQFWGYLRLTTSKLAGGRKKHTHKKTLNGSAGVHRIRGPNFRSQGEDIWSFMR